MKMVLYYPKVSSNQICGCVYVWSASSLVDEIIYIFYSHKYDVLFIHLTNNKYVQSYNTVQRKHLRHIPSMVQERTQR